jgi:hypothetical protein
MQNETKKIAALAPMITDKALILTSDERKLIENYRRLRRSAQNMLVDLSDQYTRTLPAEPFRFALVPAAG